MNDGPQRPGGALRGRLLKGAIWIGAARVLSNLLGLVSTLVLAKLLFPADFGLVALGTTLLGVVAAITEIPITEALVQHHAPAAGHFHSAFTLTALRGLVLAALFAALAGPVAHFYHDGRLVNVMRVVAAGTLLAGLSNPRTIMLTKDLVFWQQFMLQVTQRMTALVISVVVALIYRSYWALLLGTLAGQLAGLAVSYTVLPFRPRFSLRQARELMSFSVWLTFCQIVTTLNWRLDQFLIGTFLSRAQLGYYVVGDNLAVIPTREATAPLTATLFPAFTLFAHDPARLAASYNRAQALVTAVALPIGVGMALLADPLVRLVLGEKWLPAIFIIQALSAVFAVQTLGSLAQPLAMAAGQTRLLFRRDLQGFALRVPFILGGLWLDGLAGVVYARVLTGCLSILFNMAVVTRITGLSRGQQVRANLRSLGGVGIMAAVMSAGMAAMGPAAGSLACLVRVGVGVAVGGAVYGTCTWLLWLAAGRPEGAETEILALAGKLRDRLRGGLRAAPGAL